MKKSPRMEPGDLMRVASPIAKFAPVYDDIGKPFELHHGDSVVFLRREEGESERRGQPMVSVLSPIGKVFIDDRWLAVVQPEATGV